jgi:hypothetical protein
VELPREPADEEGLAGEEQADDARDEQEEAPAESHGRRFSQGACRLSRGADSRH